MGWRLAFSWICSVSLSLRIYANCHESFSEPRESQLQTRCPILPMFPRDTLSYMQPRFQPPVRDSVLTWPCHPVHGPWLNPAAVSATSLFLPSPAFSTGSRAALNCHAPSVSSSLERVLSFVTLTVLKTTGLTLYRATTSILHLCSINISKRFNRTSQMVQSRSATGSLVRTVELRGQGVSK